MLLSSIKAVYNNRIITHDNDFKESEHPRDNDGKFSSKAGGSASSGGAVGNTEIEIQKHGSQKLLNRYSIKDDTFDDIFSLPGVDKAKVTIVAGGEEEGDSDTVVSCTGTLHKGGKEIGFFDFAVNGDTLDLETMVMEEVERGGGYGDAVIKKAIALAKKLKLKHIEMFADITIGKYAWAKMGFDFADKDDFKEAKKGFKKYTRDLLKKKGLTLSTEQNNALIDKFRAIKTAKDLADFKVPGLEATASELTELIQFDNQDVPGHIRLDVGKAFMLDEYGCGGWQGKWEVK